MNKAIVVGSYVGSPWLQECVSALPKDIPVIAVCEPYYECGKIGWIHRNTNIDEFLFLTDTTIVKQHGWIYDVMNAENQSFSFWKEGGIMGSFLGKYRRVILDKLGGVPITRNKMEAVFQEHSFGHRYSLLDDIHVLWPEQLSGQRYEEKHGRMNAIIQNEHVIKYKGAWDSASAIACEQRDAKLSGRVKV